MDRINLDGVAAPKTRRPKRAARKVAARRWQLTPNLMRRCLTVALGIGIPMLSLAMSKLAGTLAANAQYGLALLALGLMLAVLGVSLNHLAWAVGNITRSDWRASWALAVALDMSLVLCELVHVYANNLGLTWVTVAVMAAVAAASMALNVWAFLLHP